ncbi:MAG: HEAT repeat domain-containing protein [Planctomycetota bacterium]|jgi:HEAT repeat protein
MKRFLWAVGLFTVLASVSVPLLGEEGDPAEGTLASRLEDLAHSDPAIRQEAVFALERFGPASKEALSGVIRALGDEDAGVYRAALWVLEKFGSPIAPRLAGTLKDPNPNVRKGGVFVLWRFILALPAQKPRELIRPDRLEKRIDPSIEAGGRALLTVLEDEDPTVRKTASLALGRLFAHYRTCIPYLDKPPVREFSMEILRLCEEDRNTVVGSLGGFFAGLEEGGGQTLRTVEKEDRNGNPQTVIRIEGAGETALRKTVQGVLQALERLKKETGLAIHMECQGLEGAYISGGNGGGLSRNLLQTLFRTVRPPLSPGVQAVVDGLPRAMPGIAEAVGDTHHCRMALDVLTFLGAKGAGAVPAVTEILETGGPEERKLAAWTLGKIGPDAMSAIPALIKAARDREESLREYALRSISDIRPTTKEVLPVLREALQEKRGSIRLWSLAALHWLGKNAAPATPELLAVLNDPFEQNRIMAERLLDNIGAGALPHLVEALGNTHEAERQARLLERLRKIGAEAVTLLIEGMKDDRQGVRTRAVAALVAIGRPSVSALIGCLKEADTAICTASARALGAIGKRLREPVDPLAVHRERMERLRRGERPPFREKEPPGTDPATAAGTLVEMLETREEAEVRRAAAIALGEIRPEGEGIVKALTRALRDMDALVRRGAAEAIGEYGRSGRIAVPALTGALEDPIEDVRRAASEALKKVRPE